MRPSLSAGRVCFSEIGEVIEKVAAQRDYRIVHEFCGHGTGELLHMPPFVRHFRNGDRQCYPVIFSPSSQFSWKEAVVFVWKDGWTAATLDGGRGAQFEHEVLITDDGFGTHFARAGRVTRLFLAFVNFIRACSDCAHKITFITLYLFYTRRLLLVLV